MSDPQKSRHPTQILTLSSLKQHRENVLQGCKIVNTSDGLC